MSKRIVIISDTQHPYEDTNAVKAVLRFIEESQPDEVVHIGDLADYPQPSTWSKGTAAEFEGSLYQDSEYIKHTFLEPLRAVYAGPIGVLEGNHDVRVESYVSRYAPAVSGTDMFAFENLLDFEAYGVSKLPTFYAFAEGWVITHGHKGGIRLTQKSGMTALGAAERFGVSVIMGHTHRLGSSCKSLGFGSEVSQTLWGVEVGNLMDMKKAEYLTSKGTTANWQQGFCVVDVEGKYVNPILVPISDGRFTVDGKTYEVN